MNNNSRLKKIAEKLFKDSVNERVIKIKKGEKFTPVKDMVRKINT